MPVTTTHQSKRFGRNNGLSSGQVLFSSLSVISNLLSICLYCPMKLYVVSATIREVEPLIKQMDAASYKLVITGVGAVAAAYQLTKIFSVDLPALVIQAGIA